MCNSADAPNYTKMLCLLYTRLSLSIYYINYNCIKFVKLNVRKEKKTILFVRINRIRVL